MKNTRPPLGRPLHARGVVLGHRLTIAALSDLLRMDAHYVGQILLGHQPVTPRFRRALVRVLDMRERDLFPEYVEAQESVSA